MHRAKKVRMTVRERIEMVTTALFLTGICVGIMDAGIAMADGIKEQHSVTVQDQPTEQP